MNKKILFLDIDGTLTIPGENQPPASALEAIRKAQANGHKAVLCTGRNYAMLKPLLSYPFDGFVGSAGGYIKCDGKVLYDQPLPKDVAELTRKLFKKHDIFATVECLEATYCDSSLDALLKGLPDGNSELERWRKAINEDLGILPIEQYDGAPIYKFIIMYRTDDQLDELREKVSGTFDFVIQEDVCGVRNGEMINRAFDKGKGVQKVCDFYGVPVEDAIGFGDSMNDISMMEAVGTSVCMENGAAALKEMSEYICPKVDEDGLARAFGHLGLV